MADTLVKNLSRLAHLTLELEKKRLLWRDWKTCADALARAGEVVIGENQMLNQLHGRLDEAHNMLSLLRDAKEDDAATTHIHTFENCIYAPEWDIAQEIGKNLSYKHEKLVTSIRCHRQLLADCIPRVENLLELLRKAETVRAAIIMQRSKIREIERLREQCDDFLDAGNLSQLTNRMSKLRCSLDEGLESALEQSIKEVQLIASHADLLLLKPPLHEKRYKFTVLLRTPSEPGSHGVNIQDTCTIHQNSYERIKNRARSIDQLINSRVRRSEPKESPTNTFPQRDVICGSAFGEANSNRQVRIMGPGERAPSITAGAKDLGDRMFRLLIPNGMQKYLEQTPCSITITTNELELPWELMWADAFTNKFLCLERPVARMPMGRAFPNRKSGAAQSNKKVEFLLIHSDPNNNLPAAGEEIQNICDSLGRDWGENINITALGPNDATGETMEALLLSGRYDVIHYAGHAFFDEREPSESGLLLCDNEQIFSQNIQGLLEGRPVVFLNACETGQASNENYSQTVWRSLLRPTEGLASSFLYGGASNCIGALWPIYDRPAAEFAVEFYGKILDGHMIGEAMRLSRLWVHKKYPEQITWAAYVLYGDPTYRMV